MVYQDFVRVNKIDMQITHLHTELVRLYGERAQLLGAKNLSTEYNPSKTITKTLTEQLTIATSTSRGDSFFKNIYEYTARDWAKYDIAVPRYKAMQAKLEKADKITQDLIKKDSRLQNHLQIRLIPPLKTLRKALQHPDAKKLCSNDTRAFLTSFKGSEKWRALIIFDKSIRQPIPDFESFLADNASLITETDTMGLGVQELISVHMQGIVLVDNRTWTILMANQSDEATAPCAQLQNGKIHVSIDDSGGILGENYFNPAIVVD